MTPRLLMSKATIRLEGVDDPGWHVVEVIRDGGPRDGARMGWACIHMDPDHNADVNIFHSRAEAEAARPPRGGLGPV